jgi:hypothetical protein
MAEPSRYNALDQESDALRNKLGITNENYLHLNRSFSRPSISKQS